MKNLVKYVLISFLIVGSLTTVIAQEAEKIFQQAMMKEEGEGNLTEAIEIYTKLVDDVSVDRAIRANALMHVGICYEKLGKKNAKSTYQKLIAEYADQTAIVAMVRKKLQLLEVNPKNTLSSGLITQHLKTITLQKKKYNLFNISPNGQNYAYMDWPTFEIMVYNFKTGIADSITQGNTWFTKEGRSNPSNPKWSPDSKKIAYQWGAKDVQEVRLVNLNNRNTQVILSGSEKEIPHIETFTRDGENILGTMEIEENNVKIQKLVMISIADKNYKIINSFDSRFPANFSFSPDGKYLLYTRSQEKSVKNDIYVMLLADKSESQITFSTANDGNPIWSPDGTEVLFLTDRMGDNDFYKVKVINGKPVGEVEIVKRNIGREVNVMGIGIDKSIYYATDNSHYDIFTLDLDAKFENNETKFTRITDMAMRSGGMAPRYSKDGRYISYVSRRSNYKSLKAFDHELGNKYFIGVYDTKTKEHKELKASIYGWFYYDINEYVPDWSYDGTKLLLYGMIRDNYQRGFLAVDVLTEKITPLLTIPNSINKKYSENRVGRNPVFSKNKDRIYYTSKDWKTLMEYNVLTKEKKSVLFIERGFFFRGFMDNQKSCIVQNSNGVFKYNLITKELTKLTDKKGWVLGWSPDEKYLYRTIKYEHMLRRNIVRVALDGSEPDKTISLEELFPNGKPWLMSMHPSRNEIVFDMSVNNGEEIYKLNGVFD